MCFVESPVKMCRSILHCWRNLYWHDISGHIATVSNATVAKHTDFHIPARQKSRPLPLWGLSVPEDSVTRMVDRACTWKWPTTDAMAPEVPRHYTLWFFLWGYVKDRVFVPPLPRDLADLKARIIAVVKTSMHPCWRVCGKNLNNVSMCAVSPVVHTSNISSCKKKISVFLWLWTIPLR